MMRILLFILTIAFAGELEVQGDLKVTGSVDANGNIRWDTDGVLIAGGESRQEDPIIKIGRASCRERV